MFNRLGSALKLGVRVILYALPIAACGLFVIMKCKPQVSMEEASVVLIVPISLVYVLNRIFFESVSDDDVSQEQKFEELARLSRRKKTILGLVAFFFVAMIFSGLGLSCSMIYRLLQIDWAANFAETMALKILMMMGALATVLFLLTLKPYIQLYLKPILFFGLHRFKHPFDSPSGAA